MAGEKDKPKPRKKIKSTPRNRDTGSWRCEVCRRLISDRVSKNQHESMWCEETAKILVKRSPLHSDL